MFNENNTIKQSKKTVKIKQIKRINTQNQI
jgi:hypothetical protein